MNKRNDNDVGNRIHSARESKNMTLEELANVIDTTKTTIHRYETGETKNIKMPILREIARVLDTTPGALLGWNREPDAIDDKVVENFPNFRPGENFLPIKGKSETRSIPIVGSVAAGPGLVAEDNIDGYLDIPESWLTNGDEHVLLRVHGDSMDPEIMDGDLALIRRQVSVDSGSLAVAIIDGDAGVIKRVTYDLRSITLNSRNPAYEPREFHDEEVQRVYIFGLVRKILRDYD